MVPTLTTKHLVSRCSDGCSCKKSQTCTRDAKEPRGDRRHEPRDLDGKDGPTEHETSDNVQTSGLKPLETEPHHVSGARRVAAPEPRTGESRHTGSKQQRPIHTQQVEKRSSEGRARVPTHTVWETKEAQKRQQVATRSAWKGEEEQPAFSPDADAKHRGTSGVPRAETASVAMRLSDAGQSRDGCLRRRTQLWGW